MAEITFKDLQLRYKAIESSRERLAERFQELNEEYFLLGEKWREVDVLWAKLIEGEKVEIEGWGD